MLVSVIDLLQKQSASILVEHLILERSLVTRVEYLMLISVTSQAVETKSVSKRKKRMVTTKYETVMIPVLMSEMSNEVDAIDLKSMLLEVSMSCELSSHVMETPKIDTDSISSSDEALSYGH